MVAKLTKRFRTTAIGVDVGHSGARAVQLRCVGRRLVIAAAARCNWRDDETPDDDGARDSNRTERLRACVRRSGFHGKKAVVDLDPPGVEYHAIDLPAAVASSGEEKVDEIVRWEVARLMGEKAEMVETRYWRLPDTQAPAPKVLGVTAPHERVLDMMSTCDQAGLHCVAVEPGAVSLARFGCGLHSWDPTKVWGLLDLATTETRLVLCLDGAPVLIRRAGSGGRLWTDRIAESLQLGEKAAEIQKCEQGIALSGRGVRTGPNHAPAREVASILLGVLRNELREITSEVKRSYEYILTCYPDARASDLILVGGGAAMRNLPEYLSEAIGIPVARASDFLDRRTCRFVSDTTSPQRFDQLAAAIGSVVAA